MVRKYNTGKKHARTEKIMTHVAFCDLTVSSSSKKIIYDHRLNTTLVPSFPAITMPITYEQNNHIKSKG